MGRMPRVFRLDGPPIGGRWRVGATLALLLIFTPPPPSVHAQTTAPPPDPGAPPATYSAERGWRGRLAMVGSRTLAEENADRLFTPASVHKLLVTTAALHFLGAEHRIVTRLGSTDPPTGDRLIGNLLVEAAGDPTWGPRFFPEDPDSPLVTLARQLRGTGVRRVEGDLVVDTRRFPGRPFPPSRALGDLAYGFAAPLAALAVNDNVLRIGMAPGARVGEPGRLWWVAPPDLGVGGVELSSEIWTVGAERHGNGTVDFLPDWQTQRITARGEYPIGEPSYQVELALPDGELWAGHALRHALASQGVQVAGRVRRATPADPPLRHELARFASPPLARRLEPILEDSHNWHAEMLLRTLAFEVNGEGRTADGLKLVRQFLVETVGLEPDAFALDDASGISPFDLLTPRSVVQLLTWAHRQPWRDTFLTALPSTGEGTLEAWPALPPLHAKTGTLRGTLALAGYLDRGPGREPMIFAVFLNHRPGERPPLRTEITRWLQGLGQ